ncbi:MAG: DUF4342 domain-containing protein [Solobacterium sp.]|nr:DUF4342 domain-containing protein [Solobacterium sp.]
MAFNKEQVQAVVDEVKQLLRKGSVARVVVRNKEDRELFSFSANAGVIGSLLAVRLAPLASLAAVLLTANAGTKVEVIKTDGTVIDLSGAVVETVSRAAVSASDFLERFTKNNQD